jgi:predicted amidohydrolase
VFALIGTYHCLKDKSNVAIIITPDGKKFEQLKAMKSRREAITPRNPSQLHIFRSSSGTILSLICLDIEHPSLLNDLRKLHLQGEGVDVILNPSLTNAPGRARSHISTFANKLSVAAVFVNNHPKGKSFVFDGTGNSLNRFYSESATVDLNISQLQELRGTKPDFAAPGS